MKVDCLPEAPMAVLKYPSCIIAAQIGIAEIDIMPMLVEIIKMIALYAAKLL